MSHLRADCSHCCGLCCVVPDCLIIQGFGVDKPADTPCSHLNGVNRCAIHATRELHGYTACRGFDCFGVGQWITQTLFRGASWTDAPDLAREMFDAYRHWAPRFEAAALLEAALPYIRIEAQGPILAKMEALTSTAITAPGGVPSDPRQLRRETLAMIRAVLRAAPAIDSPRQSGNEPPA